MDKVEAPELLVLIRHGQSLRNEVFAKNRGLSRFLTEKEKERIGNLSDDKIPLTKLGWKQARKTGVVLRERFGVPDYIYNSGYLRTVETMEGVLESYSPKEREQINIRESLLIRERDNGYTYNLTGKEVGEHFPWLQEHWRVQGHILARPPGGESLADVVLRVSHFSNMFCQERAGQKVFLFSHGRAIGCLRSVLEGWTYEYFLKWLFTKNPARYNCGISVYKRHPETGKLELDHSGLYWKDGEKWIQFPAKQLEQAFL